MSEPNWEAREAERRRQNLEECRGRQFTRTTFAAYPSLRSVEPDEEGYYYSEPYTGQEYDPEEYAVCEDGWDHEHCHVCWAHIDPGDEYWLSTQPWNLELCLTCYEHLMSGLPGEP
jgi:hypothetical protein